MAHRELGYQILNRLVQDLGDLAVVEFHPRMEGNTLHAILAPSKKEPRKPEAPKKAPATNQVEAPAPPEPAAATQGSHA
jgi:translation initiation factor IF-3